MILTIPSDDLAGLSGQTNGAGLDLTGGLTEKRDERNMARIGDFQIGEEIQVETGITNWDRSDNEFYCTVAGIDEEGRVILDAKNDICFDGRNSIQPYFVVDRDSAVEKTTFYNKLTGCYVLWDITGMDARGRFILRTRHKEPLQNNPKEN